MNFSFSTLTRISLSLFCFKGESDWFWQLRGEEGKHLRVDRSFHCPFHEDKLVAGFVGMAMKDKEKFWRKQRIAKVPGKNPPFIQVVVSAAAWPRGNGGNPRTRISCGNKLYNLLLCITIPQMSGCFAWKIHLLKSVLIDLFTLYPSLFS